MKLMPELLTHPNIPPPLHGVNPRSIMGKEAWDVIRQDVYKSTNYHCAACGVHKSQAKKHKWLECHEHYDIDYKKGRVTIKKLVPLCHYCHNFIHSGRLEMIMGKQKSKKEVQAILEHGMNIARKKQLRVFLHTFLFAVDMGVSITNVEANEDKVGEIAKWEDWRLVWDGKEYPSKFRSREEWAAYYK